MEKKEIVVTEGLEGTLPTAKIICEKCGHNEASWVIRQTRAADEPSTKNLSNVLMLNASISGENTKQT